MATALKMTIIEISFLNLLFIVYTDHNNVNEETEDDLITSHPSLMEENV